VGEVAATATMWGAWRSTQGTREQQAILDQLRQLNSGPSFYQDPKAYLMHRQQKLR
jgi:hypothetical protein